MIYNQLARGLKDSLDELSDINNQLATGKKIAKPSDDVLGTLKAMDYKLSISRNNQTQQNIIGGSNYLKFTDQVLGQISDTLVSLKKLTSQTNGTDQDRRYYANQAAMLRDTLQDLSNSTYLNSYIFSGSRSDQIAYVYDATNYLYVYQGDSRQNSLSLGPGMTLMPVNVAGNSESSAVKTPFSYTLPSPQTATLSDGSLATYTSVVDPAHHSTIIQVQITNADHPGDPNYEDFLSFSNMIDIADLLSYAWQDQEVDGATALNRPKAMNRIEALIISLEKIQNQVLTVQGETGVRLTQLNDQKSRLAADTVNLQNNLSQSEDAAMDETIVSLQKMMTTLNALRSAAAKILPQSLFDFLR
jgi:flagellar hook-associated protein 3 FlgL